MYTCVPSAWNTYLWENLLFCIQCVFVSEHAGETFKNYKRMHLNLTHSTHTKQIHTHSLTHTHTHTHTTTHTQTHEKRKKVTMVSTLQGDQQKYLFLFLLFLFLALFLGAVVLLLPHLLLLWLRVSGVVRGCRKKNYLNPRFVSGKRQQVPAAHHTSKPFHKNNSRTRTEVMAFLSLHSPLNLCII